MKGMLDSMFLTLHTDSAPLLLFTDPTALPQCSPWQLCEAGNLGSMESRMDVETEPIHFTQDDHHSIQGTNS